MAKARKAKVTKTTGKKTSKAKLTREQKKVLAEARDNVHYESRMIRSLTSILIGGYFAKVIGLCMQNGENPIAYANYVKASLNDLFTQFETQIMASRGQK